MHGLFLQQKYVSKQSLEKMIGKKSTQRFDTDIRVLLLFQVKMFCIELFESLHKGNCKHVYLDQKEGMATALQTQV